MKKRFLPLFLALALCLGLAVPAYAADTTPVTAKGITFDAIVTDRYENLKSALEDSSLAAGLGPEAEFEYHLGYQAVREEGFDGYGVASFYTYLVDHDVTLDFHVKKGEQYYVEGYYLSVVSSPNVSVPIYDLTYMGGGTFTATKDGEVLEKADIDEYYPGANCLFLFRGSAADVSFDEGIRVVFADENGAPETIPAFNDVEKGVWYENAVNWAAANGITTGTTKDKFGSTDNCTAVQILTFLWRAADRPDSTAAVYSDLPGDYAPAANWAYEQGMIGDSVDLSIPCTRANAVKLIWQALGSEAPKENLTFKDVPEGAYYAEAAAWAVELGITDGTGGGNFSPGKICNRATIATLLYRAYFPYALK